MGALSRFFASLTSPSAVENSRHTPVSRRDSGPLPYPPECHQCHLFRLKESESTNRKDKGCPLPSPHPNLDMLGANCREAPGLSSIARRASEIFEMPADPYHELGNIPTPLQTPASGSSSSYSPPEHLPPFLQEEQYHSSPPRYAISPTEGPVSERHRSRSSPKYAQSSSFASPEGAYQPAFENPFEVVEDLEEDGIDWNPSQSSESTSDTNRNQDISPLTNVNVTSTGREQSNKGEPYSPWLCNPVLNGASAATATAMRMDLNANINDHIVIFHFLEGVTLHQVSELQTKFPATQRREDALGIDWENFFREMMKEDLDMRPGRREDLRMMVRIPGARMDTFLSKYDISKFIKLNHGLGYGQSCFTLQVTNRLGPHFHSLLEQWHSSEPSADIEENCSFENDRDYNGSPTPERKTMDTDSGSKTDFEE
jgi:hypothetical protein